MQAEADVRKRVLVIEDNGAVRSLIEEILVDAGYRVYPSDHVLDPVDVQQLKPDLILLDVMIAGRPRGLDYLRLLRSQRWTARIPIIICSGELRALRQLPADDRALVSAILPKPFDLLVFLDTVATAIEKGVTNPESGLAKERRRRLRFGIPHWNHHESRQRRVRQRRVAANESMMRGWLARNAQGGQGEQLPEA